MDATDYVPGNLEKIASALGRLADAVESWVKLEQLRYDNEHPAITRNPVTVQVAEYEKQPEKGPEEEGPIFPEYVGPREQKLIEKQKLAIAPRRSRS